MPETVGVVEPEIIREEILEAISEATGYGREELEDTTLLVDLELDSLLIVELVVALRRRFGVELPPSEFRSDIETVGQLCATLGDFLDKSLNQGAASAG